MHVFLRKSPLCRSHFFEWLKTVISSNACGTSTLKSPLLRAFFTPHVHQRLRKRPPRCTLDCGFKTPESPALRGFEAERGPITGTSLYLVIFSNGDITPQNTFKTGINALKSDDIISSCGQRISCFYLCSQVYCAQTGTSALWDVTYEPDVGAMNRFLLISQQVVTFSSTRNVRNLNMSGDRRRGRRHHQAVFLHQQLLRVQSAAGHAHQGQTAA